MARTTEEIYNTLIANLSADTTLDDLALDSEDWQKFLDILKNQSKVGDLRHCIFLLSLAWQEFEVSQEDYLALIEQKAKQANYGHDQWWINRILEFQFGDTLQVIEVDGALEFRYAVVDESKRIISRVGISDGTDGTSVLKVATGSDDNLQVLTTPQQNALTTYVNKMMPPGSKLAVVSRNADMVRYYIDLYYNPEIELSVVKSAVEKAITDYHKNLNTYLNFDGRVDLRQLEDGIQAVPSVVNFSINTAQAKPEGAEYVNFNREYKTIAGYVKIDPDYPLSETINYYPYGINR